MRFSTVTQTKPARGLCPAAYPLKSMGSVNLDACVIQGSYLGRDTTDGPETVVELWCRAKQGHSLLVLVKGMRPFLEISVPGRPDNSKGSPSLDQVSAIKGVTKVHEPVDKWTELGVKPHWRVEVKQPHEVPRIRESLSKDWELSSADVVFVNRVFLDADVGPHITFSADLLWVDETKVPELADAVPSSNRGEKGRRHAAEEIRESGGSGLYPVDVIAVCHISDISRCEPFQAPFVTMSFDLETSIVEETVLCAAAVVQQGESREVFEFKGSERDILSGLTKIVREWDPDIITGYNIDNFDLTRLNSRTKELANKRSVAEVSDLFGWGRVPLLESESKRLTPSRDSNRRAWRIHGRVVLDAWWQARMVLRPQRETLKFVCQLLWPDREDLQKMDVDASKMDKEWAERPEVVMEYCVQDTILPLEILNEISAIERKEALAAVAGMPLETAIAGTTSQWIDSLVIRLADRECIAVPRTRRGPRGDQIVGGYVHEVEAGVHEWIAVLDFKSMYPSIMIANNICYTTRVDAKIRPDEVDTESHESPIGATYLPASFRKGLVPRLLESLMEQRASHKLSHSEAIENGDTASQQFHYEMQFAVKILMNSFYGVFASNFYRFTHPDLGSSITAWARSNIKGIIGQLEEEGHPVVYSDTDSVFVRAPVGEGVPGKEPVEGEDRSAWDDSAKEMVEFGQTLADRYSREGAELEFETGLSVFFSHGVKKRYVGRVIWPERSMLVRGYEMRRTDSFNLLSDAMTNMLDQILDGESDAAVKSCMELIAKVRSRNVKPRDLVISKSCKGRARKDGSIDFESVYSNPNGLPTVRAAKQRIKAGLNFTPGMKVGWLVTDGSKSPMEISAWLEDETGVEQTDFDPEFYAKRLATSLGRVTEAFGWSADDLLKGNRQTTLFSF